MAVIDTIRRKVRQDEYEVAVPHFVEEMINDDLEFTDIVMAIGRGRIRRRFTRDPRGPRYEVVGPTTDGRRIAVICRLIQGAGRLRLITTYVVK